MRVEAKVHPGSGREKVLGPPYEVWVREKAVDNKANMAAIRALSGHFGVAKSRVRLVSGARSKSKVFEVDI
jgi:uncharacterized protein YggU (UPF0235/DUF167 family)